MPNNTIIIGIKDHVDEHYRVEPLPHFHVKSTYAYAQFPAPECAKERRSYSQIFDSFNAPSSTDHTDSGSFNRFEEITCENPTSESLSRSGNDPSTEIL